MKKYRSIKPLAPDKGDTLHVNFARLSWRTEFHSGLSPVFPLGSKPGCKNDKLERFPRACYQSSRISGSRDSSRPSSAQYSSTLGGSLNSMVNCTVSSLSGSSSHIR